MTEKSRTSFEIGEQATFTTQITEQKVNEFAQLSGDTNPVHLNEDYASGSYFKHRIAHGALVASSISAVLGTKLPGTGAIYLGQEISFRAPVYLGDTITAAATVTAWNPDKGRIDLETIVTNQDGVEVITGSAKLIMEYAIKKK